MHNMSKQMGYFSRTPHRVPLQLTKLRPLHRLTKSGKMLPGLMTSSATFTQTLF